MEFKSKYDLWLVAIIGFSVVCSLGAAAFLLYLKFNVINAVIAVILALLGGVFPLWILLTTGYQVSEDQLLVTSGPFHWRIPLAEIRQVEPTRNPLSSPALSLDRLSLKYGNNKQLLISPQDKQAFLEAIRQK